MPRRIVDFRAMMSVRGKGALVLASQALSAFIAYGALVVTGRFFDPASYGMVALAFSLGSLLALVTDWGVGAAHIRRVAMGHDRNAAFGTLVRIRGMLLAVAVVVLLAAWVLSGHRLFTVFSRSVTPSVLLLGFVFQGIVIARSLVESTWQAEQKVHLIEGLRTLDSVATLILLSQAGLLVAALQGVAPPLVGVGRFWGDLLGLQGPLTIEQAALLILGCYTAVRLLGLIVAAFIARKEGLRVGPWDVKVARSYRGFALALAFSGVVALLLSSMDTMTLGAFWDAREVAYYAGGQRLASMATLGGTAVAAILFPRFAQLHSQADQAGKDATFEAAQRWLLLITAPLAAAMLALPGPGILASLGPAYLASVPTLRWLAAWALLTVLVQPVSTRLMGEGHLRPLIVAGVLATTLNAAMDLVLVPRALLGWGAPGAAAATLIATAASYAYLRLWVRRHHATPIWHAHVGRILACAAAVGVAWWAAGTYLPGPALDRSWKLLVVGLLGLAAYTGALVAAREMTSDDLAPFRAVGRLLRRRSAAK